MVNYFRVSGTFIFLFLCVQVSVFAQDINLDGLEAYWKITDKLKLGDTISKESWKGFLDLEGNRLYVGNQGFDEKFMESYRKTLQLVYNPANEDKVKKMMANKFSYWMAYKINQYKEHEAELRSYAAHLKDEAYLDSMYKNSWAWLPKQLHTKSPETKIFFIAIDNDALVQNGTIVFTLWSAYNQDKLKYGILGGHELHHVLRKPVGFEGVRPEEEGIMYVLNSILNEGSADMIDKRYSFDKTKDIVYEYHFDELLLTQPDSIVRQIDTAMQVMVQSKGQKFSTVKQYRKLINYSSGHNPGYYMADIIVRNGYGKELVKNIQNPFYFVRLYNKAAKIDKQHPPVFSSAAIGYCNDLEKKYWRTPVKI